MIKVLELIDGGFIGGGQIHVLSLSKGLDKTVFSPCIAAMGGSRFEKLVTENGLPFKSIHQPKILRKKYLNPLIEFCKEEKFDILHSHGGVSGFYGRLVKKYYPEIKTVHTIHGIHYINTKNLLRKYVSLAIEQYLVKFTDHFVCETNSDFYSAGKIKIINPVNTSIIPNGIDLKKYCNLERKKSSVLTELNISSEDFIIGNVSRFDEQKNQNLIIKAASLLKKEYPFIKFVLIGDGKLWEQSKKLASDLNLQSNILFTGEKRNLTDYYSLFDLFVFPTFWEGMPYVLLEAMACRLPIICSDIPSLKEVVKDNFSAVLFNPHSEKDLANSILKLYNDKNLLKEISSNAYESVKNYSEYFTVKKIEEIYTGVLGK